MVFRRHQEAHENLHAETRQFFLNPECPFQNGKDFPSFGLDGTSRGLRRMAVPRRGRRPPSRQARRVTRPEANDFLHSSWGNDFSTIFHTQNSNKFHQPWSVLIFWTPKLTKVYLTEFDPCPVHALLRTSFARQRAADSSQATLLPGIQAFSARKPSIDTAPIRRNKAKSQRPTPQAGKFSRSC